MTRTFAYARVSTVGQTVENQMMEIQSAGFIVEPHRFISETVSGTTPLKMRQGFSKLIDRMEKGDVLVVTKMDRLGRNASDVEATVMQLQGLGIKVYCLALGGTDLTSSSGKLTMNVINAVAQHERDLISERTLSGLRRAKAQGKKLGRPKALSAENMRKALKLIEQGKSNSEIAKTLEVSRMTIMRLKLRA